MKNKVERYEAAGRVMAETGIRIGLSPIRLNDWASFMAKIAIYDDISEISPDEYAKPEALLSHLNLDTDDEDLRTHATGLSESSKYADVTADLNTHFYFRKREAIHTIGLMKGLNPDTGRKYPEIWKNLEQIAVAGTFLDDVMDAREDAQRLPQFSARELAYSGLLRFVRERKLIDKPAWASLIKSSLIHDPKRQFSKPFIMAESLLSVSISH